MLDGKLWITLQIVDNYVDNYWKIVDNCVKRVGFGIIS